MLLTLSGGAGAGKTALAKELAVTASVGPVRVLHGDDYYFTAQDRGVWACDDTGVPRLDVGDPRSMDVERLSHDTADALVRPRRLPARRPAVELPQPPPRRARAPCRATAARLRHRRRRRAGFQRPGASGLVGDRRRAAQPQPLTTAGCEIRPSEAILSHPAKRSRAGGPPVPGGIGAWPDAVGPGGRPAIGQAAPAGSSAQASAPSPRGSR